MPKYQFNPLQFPIIMTGKQYDDEKAELLRQIDMLLEMDSGLAQPCHCEFHDPEECRKDREADEAERVQLAESIKKALML